MDYKHRIRSGYKFYSQDLINTCLPIPTPNRIHRTRAPSLAPDATKYLDALSAGGFVEKRKIGRTDYYIKLVLHPILTGPAMSGDDV